MRFSLPPSSSVSSRAIALKCRPDRRLPTKRRPADDATLSLEGFSTVDNRQATGTVQVVKESGTWKTAGLERWK